MSMSLEDYVRLEATLIAEGTIKPPRKLGNKQLIVELMAGEIEGEFWGRYTSS
jgi:hypothetical protein